MSTGSVLKKYQSHIQYRLKKENKMQLRAIMLVDVDLPDFSAAADMEKLLNETLEEIKKSNKAVSFVALDMKERRGQSKPDLKNMAFRQNKPT